MLYNFLSSAFSLSARAIQLNLSVACNIQQDVIRMDGIHYGLLVIAEQLPLDEKTAGIGDVVKSILFCWIRLDISDAVFTHKPIKN